VTDEELVPRSVLPLARRLAVERPAIIRGPFPAAAEAWYTYGGCFALTLAVHEAVGGAIEVYYRGGRPRHSFVVDDDGYALDARGRNPAHLPRRGADGIERVETVEAFRELLGRDADGAQLLEVLDAPTVRAAAAAAATFLIDATSR
jgi:hypothetical protein